MAGLRAGPGRAGPPGAAAEVSLATLVESPARWEGRQVTVRGRVVERATALGVGGVLIGDTEGHRLFAAGWTGAV